MSVVDTETFPRRTPPYLGRFLNGRDPLTVTRSDIENYLAGMYERCQPSSIWTVWRHLKFHQQRSPFSPRLKYAGS